MTAPANGRVSLRICALRAALEEKNIYSARIFLGTGSRPCLAFPTTSKASQEPAWVFPDAPPAEISLELGISSVQLKIYKHTRTSSQEWATARVKLSELVLGCEVAVSLEAPIVLYRNPLPPRGTLYIKVSPWSLQEHPAIDLGAAISRGFEVLVDVRTMVDRLAKHERCVNRTVALSAIRPFACAMMNHLAIALGEIQRDIHRNTLGEHYAVEDLLYMVSRTVIYLLEVQNAVEAEEFARRSETLFQWAARGLVAAYTFAAWYTAATYDHIRMEDKSCFDEIMRVQFELVLCRVRLEHAAAPGALDELAVQGSRQEFAGCLARRSVDYWLGPGNGSYVGPFVDIMGGLRGHVALDLLDEYKRIVDTPCDEHDGRRRTAARALMTWLMQQVHMLPSGVLIATQRLQYEGRASMAEQGAGGYADVRPAKLEAVKVAVKTVRGQWSPETLKKLYLEIVASWSMSHPRIWPMLGITYVSPDHRLALVSPWAHNGDLGKFAVKTRAKLQDDGAFVRQLNVWLKQIAEGLLFLHTEYMCHGDLRGDNVLVDDNGHALLTDFGLAVYVESKSKQLWSTRQGNPQWQAPELWCRSPASMRPTYSGDVYSWAMVAFELYSGHAPWGNITNQDLERALFEQRHPDRPTLLIDERLWSLVQQCSDMDPLRRVNALHLYDEMVEIVAVDSL